MTRWRTFGAGAIVLAATAAIGAEPPPPGDTPSPAAPAPVRSAEIVGRAFVGRDDGVAGAVVVLRPAGVPSVYRMTVTDAKGWFRIQDVSDGSWTCTIDKDGYRRVVKEAIEVRAPYRAVIEVKLEPGARTAPAGAAAPSEASTAVLRGTTEAQDRGGVGEARIRLRSATGTGDPRTVFTAADGSFAIEGLETGTWDLEILGAGFLAIRSRLEIAGDTTLEARLVPQPQGYFADPEDLMPLETPLPPTAK